MLRAFFSVILSFGFSLGLLVAVRANSVTRISTSSVKDDDSIKVSTSLQSANGLTNEGITTDEVGTWARLLNDQTIRASIQACRDNGGDATLCSQFKGEETHVVIRIRGRNIAVINSHLLFGGKIVTSAVRVMGLSGTDLVAVTCGRMDSDAPVTTAVGRCADELWKSLGIRFLEQ